MSVATNSSVLAPIAWVEIARDVRDGALALARLVVSAAGFATLVLAAVALTNDGLRHTLKAALFTPTVLASEAVAGESGTTAVDEVANKTIDPAVAADPRQKHIVQYLARRYRVAEEATRMLVATAFQVGREQKLDPLLILSVVAIESSLNLQKRARTHKKNDTECRVPTLARAIHKFGKGNRTTLAKFSRIDG